MTRRRSDGDDLEEAMGSLILAAWALACPLTMVGMMFFMRGRRRGGDVSSGGKGEE